MSFIETPRFPPYIGIDSVGGATYKTDVIVLDSGADQRNAAWDQSLWRAQVKMPLIRTQADELNNWFHAMKGRAHSFRVQDWRDYVVDQTTGRLGTSANATGVAVYQLTKVYTIGTLSTYRRIRKPVIGQVSIYRGGVLQTAGGGAGNYAVDTTTGIVTFVADLTQNVTAVLVGANTVVTLASTLSGVFGGAQLYLSGLGGTVGPVLNGLAHTVVSVSGSQYTISRSTVGLAYTSGGTGAKYAQPGDTLAWAGQFDVPVHFNTDAQQMAKTDPSDFHQWNGLELVEDRNA